LSKISNIDLNQVYDLASAGYTVMMICDAIGISRSYAYTKKDILDTIKKGHSEARQKVIKDLMSRSKEDASATASIYLSKQLKIFDDYFPTSKPKNIKEAINKIANIYERVSKNELDATKGDKLIHYLEVYIKGYEVSELDARLSKLEGLFNEK